MVAAEANQPTACLREEATQVVFYMYFARRQDLSSRLAVESTGQTKPRLVAGGIHKKSLVARRSSKTRDPRARGVGIFRVAPDVACRVYALLRDFQICTFCFFSSSSRVLFAGPAHELGSSFFKYLPRRCVPLRHLRPGALEVVVIFWGVEWLGPGATCAWRPTSLFGACPLFY